MELQDAVDTVELQTLLRRYGDVVTRRAWAELHELFTPDATVVLDLKNLGTRTIDGPSALGTFIGESLEQFEFFQFVTLNAYTELHADGDQDAATGRVWMSEHRQFASTGMWSIIYGLYQDRYERTAKGWRIASRRYQSLARTSPGMQVFPLPTFE